MLGLRFFVCPRCDTVFAGPDEPPRCGSCDERPLDEITRRVQPEPYFTPSAE